MSSSKPPQSSPRAKRMTAGQIILLIIGIVLLLPGACSLFFFITLLLESRSNTFSDPYVEIFYVSWAASLIPVAIGAALIYVARRKARIPNGNIP